jgi:hypothetical protein
MAVRQILDLAPKYSGTSQDVKPTVLAFSNLKEGSYFFELDTGEVYRFLGGTWVRQLDVDLARLEADSTRLQILEAVLTTNKLLEHLVSLLDDDYQPGDNEAGLLEPAGE